MTEKEITNIKYRLTDLGQQVGELALKYILKLEKENEELKKRFANCNSSQSTMAKTRYSIRRTD